MPRLLLIHHAVWGDDKALEIWQNFLVALLSGKEQSLSCGGYLEIRKMEWKGLGWPCMCRTES